LENDWEQVANVNVNTRAASWLAGEAVNRLVISVREKGGEPDEVYSGECSATKIVLGQGQWNSATQFQLQIFSSIDEDISSIVVIEIDSR